MPTSEIYFRKKNKYTWTANEFDEWCKKQVADLKGLGFNTSTSNVTRMLVTRVIIPNEIKMTKLIQPKIKINKKKWKEADYLRK